MRLRLCGAPEVLSEVLQALERKLVRTRLELLVRDYQAGTYVRELERYGEEHMETIERFFEASSDWCLAALARMGQGPGGLEQQMPVFAVEYRVLRPLLRAALGAAAPENERLERLTASLLNGAAELAAATGRWPTYCICMSTACSMRSSCATR